MTALSIRTYNPSDLQLQRLPPFGSLRQGLPALEHLALSSHSMDPPDWLPLLLAAMQCCPLTYLRLEAPTFQVILKELQLCQ